MGLLVLLFGAIAVFGQTYNSGQAGDFEPHDPFLVAAEALGISEYEGGSGLHLTHNSFPKHTC